MDDITKISFMSPTMIYYNGIKKFFCDGNQIPTTTVQCWGEFGMRCTTNGAIISFIIDNLPRDLALICYQADYNDDLPLDLKNKFKNTIQLNRYYGIPDSIVVPGDDLFFTNPETYLPENYSCFEDRINEVFWRGSCTANRRKDVVEALQQIKGCNVKLIHNINHLDPYWSSLPSNCFGERVDKNKFSKYKIWLSVEGWGVASDTTRALMSGCAVIYFRQTKPWFDPWLKHEENCIIIENNISELIFYINKLLNNKEYTRKIAFNGKELSNKLFKPDFYKKFILQQLEVYSKKRLDEEFVEFRQLEQCAYDEKYLAKDGACKIVFLGSCRMLILAMYLKQIINHYPYLAHSQYGFSAITTYHIILNGAIEKDPSESLRKTIENADIIICETIKHSSYLNTDRNTDRNIFVDFNIKKSCQLIQLPNLHGGFLMKELQNSHPTFTKEELIKQRQDNLNELVGYIRKYQYNELADFFEQNYLKVRLMATFAHPMPIVFTMLAKEVSKKLWNIDLDESILNRLNTFTIAKHLGISDIIDLDYETGFSG